MLPRRTRHHSSAKRLIAGALAGVAGAAVFAAEMELDRRVFRRDTDDLVLLGRFVSHDRATARAAGLTIHLANGAIAGGIYSLVFHDRLPGMAWMRGVVFATAENIVLYPLGLIEGYHPAIREGQLATYWNATAFIQETLRHVALGAVLGAGTEQLLRASTLRR